MQLVSQWESWADIQSFAAQTGQSISCHQLERWRGLGLLPAVKQVGLGQAAGSEIHYPIGTSRQAAAIAELFKIKRKSTFVGWQLWLRGFDVHKRYWMPQIETAIAELREVQRLAQDWDTDDDFTNSTVFDEISPAHFLGTPIAHSLKRIQPEITPVIFEILREIIRGEFQALSHTGDEAEEAMHLRSMQSAIGIPVNGKASKIAEMFGFKAELEKQLVCISKAFEEIKSNPDNCIKQLTVECRKELWGALQILENLHIILKAINRSPLATANAIFKTPNVQAVVIVIWASFRKFESIKPLQDILLIANSVREICAQSK